MKNLPAVQKIQAQPVVWEGLLEKEMTTHSRIFAWRIPVDRGAWQAEVHGGCKRAGQDLVTKQKIFALTLSLKRYLIVSQLYKYTNLTLKITNLVGLYHSCV